MDKVIHILSTCITFKKSRKLKLYTKLSTLSTFYVCGILDLHKEKRKQMFCCKIDKSTFLGTKKYHKYY